jgi:hypothetical protein
MADWFPSAATCTIRVLSAEMLRQRLVAADGAVVTFIVRPIGAFAELSTVFSDATVNLTTLSNRGVRE